MMASGAARLMRYLGVVQGPVSTLGSSTLAWYSSVSPSTRRQRSTTCNASDEIVTPPTSPGGLFPMFPPSQILPLKPVTSTTSVAPSQRPTESPKYEGAIVLGCVLPSVG